MNKAKHIFNTIVVEILVKIGASLAWKKEEQ
jgi:hypothetical protein